MRIRATVVGILLAGCSSIGARNPDQFDELLNDFSTKIKIVEQEEPGARACLGSIEVLRESGVLATISQQTAPNRISFLSAGSEHLDVGFVFVSFDETSISVIAGDSNGVEQNYSRALRPADRAVIENAVLGIDDASLERKRVIHDRCLYAQVIAEGSRKSYASTSNLIVGQAMNDDAKRHVRAVDNLLDHLFGSRK